MLSFPFLEPFRKHGGDTERLVRRGILQEVRMKKNLRLTLLILGAAALLVVGVSMNSSRAADSAQITVAYSGNVLGYLEPCG
jgi:hypothetical protein